MGLPSKIDMDLSAAHAVSVTINKKFSHEPTSKEKPENSPPDLALDRVYTLIRGFLVQAKSYSDMSCFTESRVLCGVVALAKVVNAVAVIPDERVGKEN